MNGQAWARISGQSILAAMCLAAMFGCTGIGGQPPVSSADSRQQLPFTESKPLVPVNTAIYVRLQQNLSSATAQQGQSFEAVLDEPLRVNEEVLVPQGAAVAGKIIAARASGHLHNSGYLRITLT